MPWRLVASCPHFARAVHGIRPPGGVYTHVAGCDLVRHSDGTWKVIEDNVRIPSGISYVLENRAAMARLVPELFASYRVRRVDHYPQLLLRRAARRGAVGGERGDGRRVDARARPTPPTSSTPSSPARWASSSSRPRTSWCATTSSTCAPRAGSSARTPSTAASTTTSSTRSSSAPTRCSACPAWCAPTAPAASRSPTRFGTGVADDKAIYCFVPEMIRFYLGEEPILENVRTYLLSDPEVLEHVLARLDQLVVKPTGESGGQRRDDRPARRARPRSSACARVISAAPRTLDRPGRRAALDRADRRPRRRARARATSTCGPFAVFGERIDIVPGGLTRVALERGLADRQLLARRRLEGHLGARGRRRRRPRRAADRRHPAARRCPTCATARGPASSSSNSSSSSDRPRR